MTVAALVPTDPATVTQALLRRGVEPLHADAAARGLKPILLIIDVVDAAARDALAAAAHAHHVECLTGDRWVALAGSAASLGSLGRPGATLLPPELAEVVGRAVRPLLDPVDQWLTARGAISLERPLIAGILNITPDSFSDGGRYLDPGAAVEQASRLVDEGAGVLDLGAESTRPGRPHPVDDETEWARLEPVLERVVRELPRIPVSIDTNKSVTAARALDSGAWAINDVTGLANDPRVADVCAAAGAGLILMHSRGTVAELATYDHARYDDPVRDITRELAEARDRAIDRGVGADRVVLDPGLGFAKTPEQSLAALRGLPAYAALGHALMVGPSRKRFLGVVTGRDVAERDLATAAACVSAYFLGAHIFRVHAVAPVREALAVAAAVRGPV